MFDSFAYFLSSIPSFLFPVFASYKALKSADPALLTPWLMYWVVLAVFLFCESWFGFILFWIPFYGYARLVFHLYLVLPQIQGATYLYRLYVDPFLHRNELAIDNFISAAHDKARTAGLAYVSQGIDYVKHAVFNVPKEPTPPPTPAAYNYAQSLFARFTMPEARPVGATSGSSDFYGLLASAVGAAASSSVQSRDAASSTRTLIPDSVQGAERLSFIEAQRNRLSLLLTALDKEAIQLQPTRSSQHVPSSGMSSRKSEPDFEKIDKTSLGDASESYSATGERISMGKRTTSSGWRPWVFGAAAAVAGARTPAAEKRADDEGEDVGAAHARDTGRSSGFEGGHL